jgi:hypothetical protein
VKFPTYKVTLSHPDTGAPDEEFDVYVDLMLDEADVLASKTSAQYTWAEWLQAVDNREPDALRFMYWLARKRTGNPIDGKFSDISFWLHAFSTQLSDPGDFADEPDEAIVLEGPDPTEGDATESE